MGRFGPPPAQAIPRRSTTASPSRSAIRRTIGTQTSGQTGLTINSVGHLKITSGGTLTLTCNAACSGDITLDGSGILEFDSTNAYVCNMTGGAGGTVQFLSTNTSSGTHATIRSTTANSANYGTITFASFRGNTSLSYVDFLRMGTSSIACLTANLNSSSPLFSFSLQHCTFTTCGTLTIANFTTDASCIVDSCTWSGTTGTSCTNITTGTARTSGTRLINNNSCDISFGPASTINLRDFTITGNLFPALAMLVSGDNPWAQLSGNLIRGTGTSNGFVTLKTVGDTSQNNPWNYMHVHNDGGTQTQNADPITPTDKRGHSIAGWIFDPGNCDTVGDWFSAPSPASSMTYIINNCLYLPIGDGTNKGKHMGTALSCTGNANFAASVTHCTWACDVDNGENGEVRVAETYAGYAGMITAVKSNLAWSANATSACVFSRISLSTVSDIASAGNLDYNGKWNPTAAQSAGGNVPGYKDYTISPSQPMFSSATGLGAHDVTVSANPFVDVNMASANWRNIASWSVHKGQSSSGDTYQTKVNGAYTYIKGDPANRIADLVNWVKGGWRVTAASLKNAGHDGVTIGALEWVSTGSARIPIVCSGD